HVGEPCTGDQRAEIIRTPERERTLHDRGRLRGDEAPQCCREGGEARAMLHGAPNAEREPPPRHQHATHLAEGPWPIWEKLQPLLTEGEVKGRIRKRDSADIPLAPLD